VFTIEPGVYFIDGLLKPVREGPDGGAVDWALVDALAPFGGVRIEDDLVVEGEGFGATRNLTREHLSVGGGAA
jgi:Xaa-Pro dipeptidase